MPRPVSHVLSPLARFVWMSVNLSLGAIPSAAFLVWVERNCSLPWIPIYLEWPWFEFAARPVILLAGWNVLLFLLFGVVHSLLAQPFMHRLITHVIPPQAIRSFYLAASGLMLVLMMSCWQHTGVVLWVLQPGHGPGLFWVATAFSAIPYWLFMGTAIWLLARLDPLHFFGFRQLHSRAGALERSEGTPRLIDTGFYSRVRHPVYLFTLLAFIVTPFMTLDRMLVTGATVLYLVAAIPIEERKLLAIFGEAYANYRKRVPAVLPRLFKNTVVLGRQS